MVMCEIWVYAAAVPAAMLLWLVAWQGIAHELSPFNDFSLVRLWFPYFLGSLLVAPFVVAFDFAVELAKAIFQTVRVSAPG